MTPRRLLAGLLTLIAVACASLYWPQTAAVSAPCPDGYCSKLYHWSPDDGYDSPWNVECKGWSPSGGVQTWTFLLPEGSNSEAKGCPDAQRVLVEAGKQIVCMTGGVPMWATEWDATGWHNVGTAYNPGRNMTCVHQLD